MKSLKEYIRESFNVLESKSSKFTFDFSFNSDNKAFLEKMKSFDRVEISEENNTITVDASSLDEKSLLDIVNALNEQYDKLYSSAERTNNETFANKLHKIKNKIDSLGKTLEKEEEEDPEKNKKDSKKEEE